MIILSLYETAKALSHNFISLGLDYCNVLLYIAPYWSSLFTRISIFICSEYYCGYVDWSFLLLDLSHCLHSSLCWVPISNILFTILTSYKLQVTRSQPPSLSFLLLMLLSDQPPPPSSLACYHSFAAASSFLYNSISQTGLQRKSGSWGSALMGRVELDSKFIFLKFLTNTIISLALQNSKEAWFKEIFMPAIHTRSILTLWRRNYSNTMMSTFADIRLNSRVKMISVMQRHSV